MNNEYQEKLALKNKLARYYASQAIRNGLFDTKLLRKYLPDNLQSRFLSRGIIIAHLDLERVLEAIVNKRPFALVSGVNSSSPLHFGHKAVFDLVAFFRDFGAQVHIPVTHDEAYFDGKAATIEDALRMARDTIIPQLASLGFKSPNALVYTDFDFPEIYQLAAKISKFITIERLQAVFGQEAVSNCGQIFYRGGVQIAQILLPQMPKYGGPKPTIVPVGIDQHPYILLARDIARELGLVPPSELTIRFQPSLKGPEEKMSKSKPDTAVFLIDSPVKMVQKINAAYTGSVSKLEDHRKVGAIPEIDAAFNLLFFHHPDDDFVGRVYKKYKKGLLTASEVKKLATDFLLAGVGEFDSKTRLDFSFSHS